jgi:hypothetical protein
VRDPNFALVMERWGQLLETCTTSNMAQSINSLSRMRDPYLARFGGAIRQAQAWTAKRLADMDTKELSLVINGFANLSPAPPRSFLDAYNANFMARAEIMDKQGVTMLANAYAKVGYWPGEATLQLIEDITLRFMPDFNSQELANMANALAKIGYAPSQSYLTALEVASEPKLATDFKPQEAWLRCFERAAIKAMAELKPQESAIIVNGFTKMEGYAPSTEFFQALERCTLSKVSQHGGQETANTIHGMGKLGFGPSRQYLEAFVRHSSEIMPRLKPQELGNLVNGLSKFTYRPPQNFFQAFIAAMIPKIDAFSTQVGGPLLWLCLPPFSSTTCALLHQRLPVSLSSPRRACLSAWMFVWGPAGGEQRAERADAPGVAARGEVPGAHGRLHTQAPGRVQGPGELCVVVVLVEWWGDACRMAR